MKRRNRFSFTDSPTTSKAICQSCYENNITSFTVPYIMDNGREDKGFRKCPYCLALTPIRLTRYNSETQPLGSNSIGKVQFEVAVPLRSRSRRNSSIEPTEKEIPPLAGKPDTDLESLLNEHNGILVSITDDYIETSEQEY